MIDVNGLIMVNLLSQETMKSPKNNERQHNMILQGLVISDVPDSYHSKKTGEEVRSHIITVVDQDKTGHRLKQSADIVLREASDRERFAGKLLDKRVEVSIKEITFFGGRPRLLAEFLTVEGKPVNGAPSASK